LVDCFLNLGHLVVFLGEMMQNILENRNEKVLNSGIILHQSRIKCNKCEGNIIVSGIENFRLSVSLCGCAPIKNTTPLLSQFENERFKRWKLSLSVNANLDKIYKGRLINRNNGSEEFSDSEILIFKDYQRKCEEIENCNLEISKELKIIWNKIEVLNSAALPCRLVPPKRSELPKPILNWLSKTGSKNRESLFLHGTPGTGKTTLAVWAAYYAVIDEHVSDIRFLTSDFIMSLKKDANVAGFNSKDSDSCRQKWTNLKADLERSSLLIIDDVGSQKYSESIEAAYSEVIGLRYNSGLPTIFTSNHGASDGLDSRTLSQQIGQRAADRVLGSYIYAMTGPSKRSVSSSAKDETQELDCDELDLERVRNFQTIGIAEGETTSPFFIAHNPVFQLVSDKERAILTDDEGRDIALPERRSSGWQEGSEVSMIGYILCQNDLLVFLAVFELMHDFHRNGGKGVSFVTTISELRRKLGLKSDAKNVTTRILRSLIRLAKTRIEYRWGREFFIGGFIEDVYHKSAKSQSRLMISINPRFVNFYEKTSFFRINTAIPANLSYHARLLYVFLESQPDDVVAISLSQLAILYGKSESAAKNRKFRESVRDSLKELKSCGVQREEAQILPSGIVSTHRMPRNFHSLSLRC
jgi:hypothetical protein